MDELYTVVAFKIGYVESNSVAWLIYQSSKIFSSRKEIVSSLAYYLFHKFKLDSKRLDIDSWNYFVRRLVKLDNDSYRYRTHEEAQELTDCDWDYCTFNFRTPIQEVVSVDERAEHFFLYALKENHPELFKEFEEMDDYDINGPNDIDKNYYEEIIK